MENIWIFNGDDFLIDVIAEDKESAVEIFEKNNPDLTWFNVTRVAKRRQRKNKGIGFLRVNHLYNSKQAYKDFLYEYINTDWIPLDINQGLYAKKVGNRTYIVRGFYLHPNTKEMIQIQNHINIDVYFDSQIEKSLNKRGFSLEDLEVNNDMEEVNLLICESLFEDYIVSNYFV